MMADYMTDIHLNKLKEVYGVLAEYKDKFPDMAEKYPMTLSDAIQLVKLAHLREMNSHLYECQHSLHAIMELINAGGPIRDVTNAIESLSAQLEERTNG